MSTLAGAWLSIFASCSDRSTQHDEADGSGSGDGTGDDDASEDGHSGGDDDDDACPRPFRDEWRVEHDGEFAAFDDVGEPRIVDLTIGTPDPSGDNFVNRGDVIVRFDGEPGRITIELRRFAFACDEDEAATSFESLGLWAFDSSIAIPNPPLEMDEASDCRNAGDTWHEACAIYVYYAGLSQPVRLGADIRVTLPPEYRQAITIATSDALYEDSYPNRGNVCVDDLRGHADIELQSGIAIVKMADDATPAPTCPAELLNDCTNVDDPTTIASMEGLWSRNCGCAQQLRMGVVDIEAGTPHAADITVDAPPELWASIVAENQAADAGPDVCPATVEGYGDAFVPDPMQFDPNEPWRAIGDANRPSDAALAGGGFAFRLASDACAPIAAVESPDAWDPSVDSPPTQTRGIVRMCVDCLGDDPCGELPGG